MKMTDTPNVGKDMEEFEFYCSLDFKMLQSLWKYLGVSYKTRYTHTI